MDIIFGIHSVVEALRNSRRTNKKLHATAAAHAQLKKHNPDAEIHSPHSLQEEAKRLCRQRDFPFQRVPSGAFLTADPLPQPTLADLYPKLDSVRLLILDGITDVHNLAAITRTAAFYNLTALLFSRKGGLSLGPGFFRISSGATEHIPLVNTPSLSRAIRQLQERGINPLGLSEKNSTQLPPHPQALVLGSEDKGLSHAVQRSLTHCYTIPSQGSIATLNVSTAAAVSLQKFFGV